MAATWLSFTPALAHEGQDPEDRTDPSVIAEEVQPAEPERRTSGRRPIVATPGQADAVSNIRPFIAGAIRIEGASVLPPSAFAETIEAYVGRSLDQAELVRLAGDVAGVARAAGYGLATAWVPEQRGTNGVLRVRIDEGRIDEVDASGPAGAATEHLLRVLVDGRPVKTAELERQLLLAEDLAGVSLGQARLRRIQGKNVLVVDTAVQRVAGRYRIDNWGSSTIGPVRVRLSVNFNGLLTTGDQLRLGVAATPLQPREFQLVEAGYSIPVGNSGTRLSARGYLSRSRAGGELRDRDLEGRSAEFETELSHPIVRSRSHSVWGHAIFGLRDSHLSREDIRAREDRIATLTGSLHGQARSGDARFRGRASLVRGLDLLGATRDGDVLASRSDADGVFTKLSMWGEYEQGLGNGFSFQLSAEGQLASDPLLASEEMGLGGREFLRGYDYREESGDQGWAAGAEMRFDLNGLPRPARRAQLYLYADSGQVYELGPDGEDGSLSSAGGGVRVWLRNSIEAGFEVGIPLDDDGNGTPDPRLSLILSGQF